MVSARRSRRRLECIGVMVAATIVPSPSYALLYPTRSASGFSGLLFTPTLPARLVPISREKCILPHSSAVRRLYNGSHARGRRSVCLTTKEAPSDDSIRKRKFQLPACFTSAANKFKSRPSAYLLIPVIAAFVGWFTNYLAVQMIFYPIQFRGIPILVKDEVPLGLIGWQGIVPCKTRAMSATMVNMVTTQLLNIEEVFRRLDPNVVADLLGPEVPKLVQSIANDMSPSESLSLVPRTLFFSLPMKVVSVMSRINHKFLHDFTVAMQDNIGGLLNVKQCVIDQMMQDRALLGELFRKCGQAELDFLTNSGLWFGFILGLIQMVVALFWENPWALSIGGSIVGLATNWLALKWIFEPVNPTKIGPFLLQGQFLRRQKEVSREFSAFFANNVLTSEKLWESILNDPSTKPSFGFLFSKHLQKFACALSGGFGFRPGSKLLSKVSAKAIEKLPNHLHVLHPYVDKTLALQTTLRTQMEKLPSAKFERVLHPIFEEDELTLILAGGFLGFLAGLIQQGIETGVINFPDTMEWIKGRFERVKCFFRKNKSA